MTYKQNSRTFKDFPGQQKKSRTFQDFSRMWQPCVNHLFISTKFPEMFVTWSIDKFSSRISTRGIILVIEGRASDKNIDYFIAIRVGTEVYRS